MFMFGKVITPRLDPATNPPPPPLPRKKWAVGVLQFWEISKRSHFWGRMYRFWGIIGKRAKQMGFGWESWSKKYIRKWRRKEFKRTWEWRKKRNKMGNWECIIPHCPHCGWVGGNVVFDRIIL